MQNSVRDHLRHRSALVLAVATVLVLIRIPFCLTGHIQEDAFISWRCAINLAETGTYGFNRGEIVSASTSHLYVFVAAIVHRYLGPHLIPVLLAMNTLFFVHGCYLICSSFFASIPRRLLLWVLVSMSPVALVISYAGMETALLLYVFSWLIWAYHRQRNLGVASVAAFLLPWVRPDWAAVGVVVAICWTVRARRVPWAVVAGLLGGVAALGSFNYLYFGSPINHSVIAKEVAYSPDRSLAAFVANAWRVGAALFLPVSTKYLGRLAACFAVGGVTIIGLYWWWSRRDPDRFALVTALCGAALVTAAGYAAGGIIFAWYLWPSQLMLCIVVFAAALDAVVFKAGRGVVRAASVACLALVALCGAVAQFAVALNTGTQESGYRKGVATYVRSISGEGDSIMLEPCGYIPFYSGRYTHDEVGMGSPEVTEYRRRYGKQWWLEYVRKKRPTYLIERPHMLRYETLDGYRLSAADIAWFEEHYAVMKHFVYRPQDFSSHKAVAKLLRLGGHSDYILYARRGSPSRPDASGGR